MNAAVKGHLDIAEVLIKDGAELNTETNERYLSQRFYEPVSGFGGICMFRVRVSDVCTYNEEMIVDKRNQQCQHA